MSNFNIILGINVGLTLAKVFFLVVDFMFIIFLLVVFKQVSSMNIIISDENDSFILKSFIVTLLIISISLFLTGLVIL